MKRVMGKPMKQFDIEAENRPGALSAVCEALAANAVNIKAISTDGTGRIRIVTEDDSTARGALERSRVFFTENDILSLRLIDRPGELAKIAKILSNHKVNINSLYILGKNAETRETEIALEVSDMPTATKIIGQLA